MCFGQPTSRQLPSGRVNGTWGRGLATKKGESEGKLASWIRMLVHPESAMRGKGNVDGNTDERADAGAGRDTG